MFASPYLRRRLTALLALAAIVLVALLYAPTSSPGASVPARHVVAPGETVWSIALEHYGGDPRERVHAIAEANDLDGYTLVAGQELMLP